MSTPEFTVPTFVTTCPPTFKFIQKSENPAKPTHSPPRQRIKILSIYYKTLCLRHWQEWISKKYSGRLWDRCHRLAVRVGWQFHSHVHHYQWLSFKHVTHTHTQTLPGHTHPFFAQHETRLVLISLLLFDKCQSLWLPCRAEEEGRDREEEGEWRWKRNEGVKEVGKGGKERHERVEQRDGASLMAETNKRWRKQWGKAKPQFLGFYLFADFIYLFWR